MKRTLLVLLLGLAAGVTSHVAWFSFRRPVMAESLDGKIAWMQTHLGLDAAQAARLRALHAQSAPRLLQLAAQVASMQEELAAFERARQTTGHIDFLEFARFVEQRRALDRACLDSTRTLVAASADVMTPEQREHYFSLLEPALKPARPLAAP
jgi:hypothetical protein